MQSVYCVEQKIYGALKSLQIMWQNKYVQLLYLDSLGLYIMQRVTSLVTHSCVVCT